MTLKEIIKDNFVYFNSLRQGFAYYRFFLDEGDTTEFESRDGRKILIHVKNEYQFTIPLDDIGNGTLKSRMKAIECMRWIRKALELNELVKIKHDSSRKTEASPGKE